MVAHLHFLEKFSENNSCYHGERPAAEEVGVLCLDDAGLNSEVRDEGSQASDMGAVGDEGDCIEIEIVEMLMPPEVVEHTYSNMNGDINMIMDNSMVKLEIVVTKIMAKMKTRFRITLPFQN